MQAWHRTFLYAAAKTAAHDKLSAFAESFYKEI